MGICPETVLAESCEHLLGGRLAVRSRNARRMVLDLSTSILKTLPEEILVPCPGRNRVMSLLHPEASVIGRRHRRMSITLLNLLSLDIFVGYQWITSNFSCRLLALRVCLAITVPLRAWPTLLGPAVKASSASREPLSPTTRWRMGPVAHVLQVLSMANEKTWEGWNENSPESSVSSPPLPVTQQRSRP